MPQIFFMVHMVMNLSLLMITLITKKVSIDGLWGGGGEQILSEDFSWTKISSTTSKICASKNGFTLYFK